MTTKKELKKVTLAELHNLMRSVGAFLPYSDMQKLIENYEELSDWQYHYLIFLMINAAKHERAAEQSISQIERNFLGHD